MRLAAAGPSRLAPVPLPGQALPRWPRLAVGVRAALIYVTLPLPGQVGGLRVRVAPDQAPLGGGEALEGGAQGLLPALTLRPEALLLTDAHGGGQLKRETFDGAPLRAAILQREERLLPYVPRPLQGPLGSAAGALLAARGGGGEREALRHAAV